MRSIDIHAHLIPQCLLNALDRGEEWHGIKYASPEKTALLVTEGRSGRIIPKLRFPPEERIKDMDEIGTDVQVISLHTPLFGYHLDPEQGLAHAREINDEIASMSSQWPQRFAGLATLPLQDIDASIAELDRAVNVLGLKGAEFDTVVNGKNWDESEFLPLFEAAESMGAVLFYHPQPQSNVMREHVNRYALTTSVGVLLEDTLIVATLIFGGILEKYPDLKVCIAHGGGYACFGMGRLDRGWQVRSEARVNISRPPSAYERGLYYDTVVQSEAALRFLIDRVGIDRVVLGSDYPLVSWDPSPTGWIQGLERLTQEEKDKILWKNLESLLGI